MMYPCRLLERSHTNQAGHCVVAQQLLQRAAWGIPFYYLLKLNILPKKYCFQPFRRVFQQNKCFFMSPAAFTITFVASLN